MKKYSYTQLFSYTFLILFIMAVFFYWKFEIKEYVIVSIVSIKMALVFSVIISIVCFFSYIKNQLLIRQQKNIILSFSTNYDYIFYSIFYTF